jgi:hypothetical protein
VSWRRDLEAAVGRRGAAVAVGAVVAGAAAFLSGLGGGRAPGTYGTLIASWMFFAGGALGAVTFGALFRIIPARWARALVALGRTPAVFAPAALALLVVVLAGAEAAPWVAGSRGWLATPLLVARELVLGAALFGAAWLWFGPRSRPPAEVALASAVTFLIGYTIVLSIWAFDFVLGPDPVFGSTVIGPFVFVSTFLAGADLLVLLALARDELSPSDRHDAASLLLAVTVFWSYLFASQFLTIWYGNLPDETEFLLRRMQGGWGWTGLAMLVLVFATPFAALLHPVGKSSPRVLAAVLVGQLVGIWLDLQILVVPTLTSGDALLPIHPRAFLIGLGVLGAFVLSVAPALRHATPPAAAREVAAPPERRTL